MTVWKTLLSKKVAVDQIAKLLQRDVKEISGGASDEVGKARTFEEVAPRLDLIWAHRYIYFVYKTSLISDEAYDDMVKEEIEFGGGEKAFVTIKLRQGWPDCIKSLALYLVERMKK
jgi:hypothetical protein